MNRRQYLIGAGALIGALHGGTTMAAARGQHVVVIGAGIIGASIAYHLTVAGAQVTILESVKPTAGATHASFAWLNAGGKRPRPYHELNLLGIMGWYRLQRELGAALPVKWGGCVEWCATPNEAERMRQSIARQQAWGYSQRQIDEAEFAALLPGVTPGNIAAAMFSDVEGTASPTGTALALLNAAVRKGARLEYPVAVTGFEQAGGRVRRVLTNGGAITTDDVVIAAGLGTTALAAKLGANVPLGTSLGLLAHSLPERQKLGRLAQGPGANVKQDPDGTWVVGASFADTPGAQPTREAGLALFAAAAKLVPDIRTARLGEVTLGRRVLPKDAFPIVGHLSAAPNVYVAAMHSGMTMAPLIGQLAATEILGGAKADLLDTFRPGRFA
jgi:glycine/D-amino acid oxidase-like deaminating enzyme